MADFNGDGRTDFLRQEKGSWDDDRYNTANVFLSQGNGNFSKIMLSEDFDLKSDDGTNLYIADFNGDGKSDILRQEKNGWSSDRIRTAEVLISQGNGSFTKIGLPEEFDLKANDGVNLYIGDFNGDGRSDILRQEKNGWSSDRIRTAEVLISQGNGSFTKIGLPEEFDLKANDGVNLFVADFNGDGKSDILRQEKNGWASDRANTANVLLSQGNGSFRRVILPEEFDLTGNLTNIIAGQTNFKLNSTPPARPDYAGNTTGSARYIGTLGSSNSSYRDWVGSADTNDYYRFNISGRSNFTLNLTGLSSDADVQLLNSAGNQITYSNSGGNNNESINTQLSTGTYYVRVYPYSGNTNYNLSLNATRVNYSAPVAIDDSGWRSVLNARNSDFGISPAPWYAKPGEWETELVIGGLANGWAITGNDDASELLKNYLNENNGGRNYDISFDEAIRESSTYRNNTLNGMVNSAWSTISGLVRSDYYSGQVNNNLVDCYW
jgi:hypothetical protein